MPAGLGANEHQGAHLLCTKIRNERAGEVYWSENIGVELSHQPLMTELALSAESRPSWGNKSLADTLIRPKRYFQCIKRY